MIVHPYILDKPKGPPSLELGNKETSRFHMMNCLLFPHIFEIQLINYKILDIYSNYQSRLYSEMIHIERSTSLNIKTDTNSLSNVHTNLIFDM